MAEVVRIGTRGSKLALWQADWLLAKLKILHPELDVEIKIIKTTGDKIMDVPLAKIGDKGLFTKELERALLDREIDLAVHSMKDLPTRMDDGLAIGAVSEREDFRDAFISADDCLLADLPSGAVVGTSSLRRRSQLLANFPHLMVADLRGNVDTRLSKVLDGSDYAGAVMAFAGLKRLGLADRVTEVLDPDLMLPAVGQGAIAVQMRMDDKRLTELLAGLGDPEAMTAVFCERALLRRLEGGCQVPIASLAQIENGKISLRGLVADIDGAKVFKARMSFAKNSEPETVGVAVAENLLEQGAGAILAEIFAQVGR